MIELITEGMKGNVVALTTHGKVSHEDREQVLIPAIEEKIKKFAKIRLFYHTGNDFTGYGAKAIWDDAKIAVQHSTAFERVAVVTDIFWVKETVGFFGHLMRCAVRKKGTGIFLSTRKSLRGLPDMSFVEISTCLWQVARKRLSSGRFPLNPQTS